MADNKTILITGASGFLGTWLADEAAAAGYVLVGVDLRTPARPGIWSAFATSSLETVDLPRLLAGRTLFAACHLAGGASVPSSVNDPFGDFSSLMPGTARLALYLTKAQPQARLFMFSSAAVYGNPTAFPITERTPVKPISPYGAHKATTETLLFHYSGVFGLRVTIFRLCSVYGSGLRKQIIWDVSQRALQAIKDGQNNILLFGTGKESRDFIHAKDVCQAVLLVMATEVSGDVIYNVASGVESKIIQVARCLLDHLNLDLELSFSGRLPQGDPVKWKVDIRQLKTLGFRPHYCLESGIQEVAGWIKSQKEIPRPAAIRPASAAVSVGQR